MVYGWRPALPRLPHSCLLCDTSGTSAALCDDCLSDLPWNLHACRYCALPVPDGQGRCGDCDRRLPRQERTIAPLRYEFPVDHLVSGLKYHGRLASAPLLGGLLRDAVLDQPGPLPDLVLPVPLHARRLGERGYNQALEIARPLARATGLPLETRLLQRHRATAAQMTLDAARRARNPDAAFQVDARRLAALGHPVRVAVVDDVMTTGATLTEIARVLQEAGIAGIEFWVVARTP
jgi:ComF family protein